jgi:hypothetical protein
MRWFEILKEVQFKSARKDGNHQIFVSNQFKKNFNAYRLLDRTLENDFNDFLNKKMNGEILSKDNPFVGPLAGVWHYHIRFGRLILTYAMDNEHIEIYTIDDHSAYDGDKARIQLRKNIKAMDQNSFEVWYLPINKIEFTKQQLSVVENLLYSLVDEVDILKEYIFLKHGLLEDLIIQELNIKNEEDLDEFLLTWEKQYKISFDKFIKRLIPANTN